jgi:adenylate cyclase class IV
MGERSNLEVKVVNRDPDESTRACIALGARDEGLLRQRDTYFDVRSGRLKLREDLDTSAAELVFYAREDVAAIRPSRYLRAPVTAVAEVRDVLRAALGILGVVEKRRRLFIVDNVRIHLDDVLGLGTFLELEAVLASPRGAPTPEERVALSRVAEALRIEERESMSGGYLDLLLSAAAGNLAGDPGGRAASR